MAIAGQPTHKRSLRICSEEVGSKEELWDKSQRLIKASAEIVKIKTGNEDQANRSIERKLDEHLCQSK
jgi:hypothetical protein